MFEVEILADSVNWRGERLVSFTATYPRFIHSEVNTHRLFSRNSASSRAIPTAKLRELVMANPALPIHIGKNQPGMSASEEVDAATKSTFLAEVRSLLDHTARLHEKWEKMGIHKQVANRYLEPWMPMTVLITTEMKGLENFLALRLDVDAAQPEIVALAEAVIVKLIDSKPKKLDTGGVHCPYMCPYTRRLLRESRLERSESKFWKAVLILAGRCARLSYLTHEKERDWKADHDLGKRLMSNGHMSPFEHIAQVGSRSGDLSGNFQCHDWVQIRKLVKDECRGGFDLRALLETHREKKGLMGFSFIV